MREPIEDALVRLRDASSGQRAPEHIEAKLLASFRTHHRPRKRRSLWIPAAVAASLVLALALQFSDWQGLDRQRPPQPVQAVIQKEPARVAAPQPRQESPVAVVKSSAPAIRKRHRKPAPDRQVASAPPRPQEFIEIPYTPALSDYDSGRVVRVNMPGASVRSLGLPVMSEQIQADLLLGDDGIARAIRVVSGSGSSDSWGGMQGAEYKKVRTQ